ncbi:HD-GYP domain-containing protein [Anaerobranca gottschalkii]|uniref:HD-GYP domain, c-di-GMP phosphodiesterase class II (Or its inactivated variant) n=1 Tax=Anaerobranca gottschalkii DSM 13577 TaxID=1120990 RepID=A0A1I0BFD9_9FIRM|nr:HD-GYP domain-containing protein [Anaerobranca gottschalkii]SET05653.1 HD-GYP domain, c-di-GMP phosphodiesterase class II (or its inactivated variant) [Anaerobranca gottschalkii DSM 13577]
MRRVAVNLLKEGDILANPVKSPSGSILLAKGTRITQNIKNKLPQLGIAFVYIEDSTLPYLSIHEIISEDNLSEAIKTIKKRSLISIIIDGVQRHTRENLDLDRLNSIVNNIIDELMDHKLILSSFAELKLLDNYTYQHSINVCIYSLIIGHSLKFTRTQLFQLGLGALLHDIGKTKIPISIINKPGILSVDEYEKVIAHTILGFELIKKAGKIPLLSAHVALQHHERLMGSGYPRKLKGDAIHPFGYIVGIADMFDALTAEKPYRPRFSIKDTIEILESSGGNLFPQEYIEKFLQTVILYPLGYKVKLNNGEVGVVIGQGKNPLTPIIKVIKGEFYQILDLEEYPQLFIEEVVYE